jgi:hypothetical protein
LIRELWTARSPSRVAQDMKTWDLCSVMRYLFSNGLKNRNDSHSWFFCSLKTKPAMAI